MKYSVLMAVYAKEKPEFFKLAIESMIQQSTKPDEIIVVQDGPLPEDLYQMVHGYENDFPDLVQIIVSEENIGLGLALNLGLKHCKNNLIARMDTDDVSLPDRCSRQLQCFEQSPDLDFCGTWVDEFITDMRNPISTRKVPINHDEIYKFGKRRSAFNHPTVMFRKSKVILCGGYGNLRRNQDVDLFGRMLFDGMRASNIPQSLLLYRNNDDLAQRRRSWENSKSYIAVINKLRRLGYSNFLDLLFVMCGQLIMFISPIWLQRIIYKIALR